MPLYIVATTTPQTDGTLRERIVRHFPNSHFEIGRGQWVVSYNGLARTLFERLAEGNQYAIPGTVTFGINGYYGFASGELWEWIEARNK